MSLSSTRVTVTLQRIVFAVVLAGGLALACSSGDPKVEDDGKICAPGTNVVCKCANLETGTKLCNDEGTGYSTPCNVAGSEECPGGELPDPGSSSSSGRPSSSSSSGSTGAIPDACPGTLVAVPADAPIALEGDTNAGADDATGTGSCAAGEGANDHVYRVVPAGRGALKVQIKSDDAAYAPVAYLRRGDCESGAEVACVAAGASQGTEFTVNVVEGEPYWLVVDGAAGQESAGKYKVTLSLTPGAFCGDTVADPGEVCDDGNNVDGDGCSADCKNFNGNPTTAVQCPGQQIHVFLNNGDTSTEGTGSTDSTKLVGARNEFSTLASNCSIAPVGTTTSNEHVYDLVAHGNGDLLVELSNTTFDSQVSFWSACTPENSNEANVDCNVGDPGQAVSLPEIVSSLTLVDGQHYTLVVDGNADSGDYKLTLVY